MDCDECKWHVIAYYGRPTVEMNDECEYHNMVLHDDDRRCEHYEEEE